VLDWSNVSGSSVMPLDVISRVEGEGPSESLKLSSRVLSRPVEPKRDLDIEVGFVDGGAEPGSVRPASKGLVFGVVVVGETGGEMGDGSPWWMATLDEINGG